MSMADDNNAADAMVIEVDRSPNVDDVLISNPIRSTNSTKNVSMKKMVKLVVFLLSILRGVELYCLLTLATIVVVPTFLLISTLVYVFRSMTGHFSHKRVARPISDGAAIVILALTIIMLSVCLWIVRSVDHWEHHILVGLQVEQWIKICIIVFGYYCVRIVIDITVKPVVATDKWLQDLMETVYCLLLLPAFLLINKVVPSLKHHKILGLLVWKWLRAIVLIVLAQYVVLVVVRVVVFILDEVWCSSSEKCKGQNCVYYYAKGLRKSITFVIVALMHLFTWQLYFRPRFVKHSEVANTVSDYGTWTLVTELICAVLLLIKNFILLSWQAHAVYERSDDEIVLRKLRRWYCLYCFDLIKLRRQSNKPNKGNADQEKTAQLNPQQGWVSSLWTRYKLNYVYQFLRAQVFVNTQKENEEAKWQAKQEKHNKALSTIRDFVVKGEGVMRTKISIHEKIIIAQAFLLNDRSLPDDQHISDFCKTMYNLHNPDYQRLANKAKLEHPDYDYADHIINNCHKEFMENFPQGGEYNVAKIFKQFFDDKVAMVLNEQLQETNKNPQEPIQAQDMQAYLEKAQQSCLQLQHFQTSAQAVVKFLNRLMIGFIIALVIVIWLLLTQILSTKAIVVISSPLLAATFIFGDTLKTMFQGIVFAYFMHPFTIGDLCIINKTQMEVKKIGIWRTTFSKLGTEEDVLYPNSDLVSKAIINYGGKIILHDTVEFSLKYNTNEERIRDLKGPINDLRNKPIHKSSSQSSEEEKIDQNQSTTNVGNPVGCDKNKGIELANGNQSDEMHSADVGIQDQEKKKGSRLDTDGHDHCQEIIEVSTGDQANKIEDEENNDESHEQPLNSATNSEDNDNVVVKHIHNNIKMALYIDYDKSILDMTNEQAYNEKLRQKSDYLRQIADLISANDNSPPVQDEVPLPES